MLTEKLSEAAVQVSSFDKLRAADAANIRQYMNENDSLRKKCVPFASFTEFLHLAELIVWHCVVAGYLVRMSAFNAQKHKRSMPALRSVLCFPSSSCGCLLPCCNLI